MSKIDVDFSHSAEYLAPTRRTSLLSGRRGTFVLVVGSNDSTDRALPHKRISKEQENEGRFQLRREETAQPFFKVFISRGLNKITEKMRQTPF